VAQLTLNPNDASCDAWYGRDGNPPDNLATWKDNEYTSGQENVVSTDDTSSVDHNNAGPPWEHAGHLYLLHVGDPGTLQQLDITVKMYDSGGENGDLHIWDAGTSSWTGALDSHYGGAPAPFTLSATLTSDLADYVDGNGDLHIVVYNDLDGPTGCQARYAELVVTYEVASEAEGNPRDLTHGHALDAATASQAHSGTAGDSGHGHALAAPSTTQAHVASATELTSDHALQLAAGAITITATPDELSAGQSLEAASGDQAHVAALSDLLAGHPLDSPGVSQVHVATPTELAHGHSLGSPTGVILLEAPAELIHGQLLDAAEAAQAHVATPVGLSHGHEQQNPVGTVTYIAAPLALWHLHELDAPSVAQQHIAAPVGLVHAQGLDTTLGFLHVHLYVSVPEDDQRRLSWEEPGTVYLVIDGQLEAEIEDGHFHVDAERQVRGILIGYLRRVPDSLPSPLDEVLLTITGDPVLHHIERRPDDGDWERIASILGDTYRDGPLDDGLYHYRAVAEDEEGDTAPSEVESVSVSSMPDPPSGLDWTWNPDTKTLTLHWQASPSEDVLAYRLREGTGLLEVRSAPVYEGPSLSWERVFTDETEDLLWSVRAVDADGNEEQNVSQVLAIPFEDGAPSARPAEPRWVEARAIEDGKIELEWLYDPRYEAYGPGAAHEARIYWDAGTGEIDFSAPHATVPMDNPTSATRYTWQSAPLTDGQTYRFTIRIATAPWPAGLETHNTDGHSATADSSAPLPPLLSVEIM
jgi:hypothetical protein